MRWVEIRPHSVDGLLEGNRLTMLIDYLGLFQERDIWCLLALLAHLQSKGSTSPYKPFPQGQIYLAPQLIKVAKFFGNRPFASSVNELMYALTSPISPAGQDNDGCRARLGGIELCLRYRRQLIVDDQDQSVARSSPPYALLLGVEGPGRSVALPSPRPSWPENFDCRNGRLALIDELPVRHLRRDEDNERVISLKEHVAWVHGIEHSLSKADTRQRWNEVNYLDFPRFRRHLSAGVARLRQGGVDATKQAAIPAGVPA